MVIIDNDLTMREKAGARRSWLLQQIQERSRTWGAMLRHYERDALDSNGYGKGAELPLFHIRRIKRAARECLRRDLGVLLRFDVEIAADGRYVARHEREPS